nr:putative reverse transcriptase domain-containing protein [Tanacetum cinerariifolium]
SASTGGSADVQGYSYKTFMNCKPHSFNGTKGVVGLKRWFEKMGQVFEICKCTEDDKVTFVKCTLKGRALTKKIEKYVHGFPERIKGNITSSKPTTLHDATNMACELVDQAVQGRATRIVKAIKGSGKTTKETPTTITPTTTTKTTTVTETTTITNNKTGGRKLPGPML